MFWPVPYISLTLPYHQVFGEQENRSSLVRDCGAASGHSASLVLYDVMSQVDRLGGWEETIIVSL